MDLPRFCSGHLIAKNAIKEDGHGIETQRKIRREAVRLALTRGLTRTRIAVGPGV